MRKLTVREDQHSQSLQQYLAETLEISKRKAKALLDRRSVFVNGKRVWIAGHRLSSGDRVEVQEEANRETFGAASILHDTSHLAIVNKPAGMLTNEGGSSVEALARSLFGAPQLLAVHRLDRDTSGCLLLAKSAAGKTKLEELFRKRTIGKIYVALVSGEVRGDLKEITIPIDGEHALTRVLKITAKRHASLLEVEIETGRMHQIRKHLAAVGHPVLGDKEYLLDKIDSARQRKIPRQMLHASRLEFDDPWTNTRVTVEAPVPADFLACQNEFELGTSAASALEKKEI